MGAIVAGVPLPTGLCLQRHQTVRSHERPHENLRVSGVVFLDPETRLRRSSIERSVDISRSQVQRTRWGQVPE